MVAFDKHSGEELWRALPSEADLGVAQPIIIEAGGARQLIIWDPDEVVSLDPASGAIYWRQPYAVGGGMTVAVPVQAGAQLFFTTFYDGPMMMALNQDRPAASVAWKGTSNSEIRTEGLHAVLATPIVDDGYIYGIGQLRPTPRPRRPHRRAALGNAGGDRGAAAVGLRIPGPQR